MKKFIIYVGLNDQTTKMQEITTLDAYKITTNIFIECTGGATITEARGVYTHEDGTIITENTLRCEIFGATEEQIEKAASQLKVAFNQEYVAIETAEINSILF